MEESIEKQTTILNKYIDRFLDIIPEIIIALIVFVIGIFISKIIKKMMTRFFDRYQTSRVAIAFFINIVQSSIIVFVIIQSLSILGMNTGSLTAIFGAAGISVGFAFKDVISNLCACLIIVFFRPFEIGDYIKCADVEGVVKDIQIFSTNLSMVDNKTIIMPNINIVSNPVINYTAQNKRRIDFTFNIEYDTDIKLLYDITERLFLGEERILDNPKPLVGIDSMENNYIKFVAKPWVKTDDYQNVFYKLMDEFKEEFDKNEIRLAKINIISK